MSDRFDNLRFAVRGCIEQLGASRNEELFEFRNAATVGIVQELLREHDRLLERAATPIVAHSLGMLTAEEATLIEAFRQADDRSKVSIQIAAEVALQMTEEYRQKARCEVVGIASARPLQAGS